MDINAEFSDESKKDFLLVNGQYVPTIEMRTDSAVILRVVHAAGGKPLPMTLSTTAAASCSMAVLAWDGVYLDQRLPQSTVNMVAASRVEVEVVCSADGVFTLLGDGEDLLTLLVYADGAGSLPAQKKASVTDAELAGIVRPWYLSDLTGNGVTVDTTYEVSIDQAQRNHSVCGFVIGAGSNCSDLLNEDQCSYEQFYGQRGTDAGLYLSHNRLVTYVGAVNEFTLRGTGTAFHPLHIHVNHFQVVSWSSNGDFGEAGYIQVGQWRDTVPPIAEQLTLRFRAADFTGETIMHCHFQRHEDLGMMDSFLVTDTETFDLINSAVPTASPTGLPTAIPTPVPTALPTAVPTAVPTTVATFIPTTVPTSIPTAAPTAAPSAVPTTGSPTFIRTTTPTCVPTDAPTAAPTYLRTSRPTAVPTTAVPTAIPTLIPTAVPTTAVPTAIPTLIPTAVPTNLPTFMPTAVPTILPTNLPTAVPTLVPTAVPTPLPTLVPSSIPTAAPTSNATDSSSGGGNNKNKKSGTRC